MNLTSCNDCGTVIDKSKLQFPTDLYNYSGSIDNDKAEWNGDDFIAFLPCPVCECPIMEDQ